MTDDWHPDLQELAAEYSPGYVITAMAVRQKIDEEGVPGIHFTETTSAYMKQIGSPMVKAKVEHHMQKEIDKVEART